ncbi:MAG: hypothetical protein JNK05_17865 [Myxococcales bacterium]|nr:hypothetical protein [Myxococcales bacterium]
MFARLDVGRARLDEIAQHIREQDEAHRAELEAAWRGELPPDPMPREYPSTLAAEVMLERAEGRFRVAHFVRFGRSADAWARWLSMREIAFASALGAMAFAHTSPAKRRAIAAEYEARANRARAWTDAKAREKAIRCALYELLEAYRVHPDEADAKNIATSWMLEAPELGDVDALRVVRGVSLASTLEAWRTTAEGKRNRGAKLYATLSQFFRRVAGMAQVREATVETESRDARAAWRKPKRAMPAGRRSKKKGKR